MKSYATIFFLPLFILFALPVRERFYPGNSRSARVHLIRGFQEKPGTTDSVEEVKTFFNETFRLNLRSAEPDKYDFETNNSLLTITRIKDNKVIINDSLGCMVLHFQYADYDRDGLKDIMVYHFHGARANTTYYLYLADKKTRTFQKVQGFEDLPNTTIDKNKIITSTALYGMIGYSFFIITKDKKIKQIGKTVETDPLDKDDLFGKEYAIVLKMVRNKHR